MPLDHPCYAIGSYAILSDNILQAIASDLLIWSYIILSNHRYTSCYCIGLHVTETYIQSCFLQVIASGIILLDYVWISLYHTHYWVLFVNDGSYDGSFIGPYSLSLDRHASFYQVSGSLNKDCFLGCFSEFFPTLFLVLPLSVLMRCCCVSLSVLAWEWTT